MKVTINYDYAMPIPMIDEVARRFEKLIKTCKIVCPGINLDDDIQYLELLKSESRIQYSNSTAIAKAEGRTE